MGKNHHAAIFSRRIVIPRVPFRVVKTGIQKIGEILSKTRWNHSVYCRKSNTIRLSTYPILHNF